MLNTRQFNTTQLNTAGINAANVSAKSTVTVYGVANTLVKSTVNVISDAKINLGSVLNVAIAKNVLVKSTVSTMSEANVNLSSTVRIESSQIPSLYVFSAGEQLQTILVNQGESCPFYNPVHDEKINLENTFTFEIPADHADSQFVVEGSLVAFQDLDLNWQVFEVKRIVDTDGTSTIKQVYCDHAFYELLGDIVPSGGGNGTSAWIAVTSALSQSRWEVGNVVNLGIQTTAFSYQTALGCLQQVATTWQGELQFRIIITNGVITHRYVDLVAQRGTSTGKQFVFGKDLEKVEREVDFNGLYTAMYGRGKATTEGARLNFASINGGLEYVADDGALALYGLAGGTRHRFGIFDDSQEADPAVLLTKTTAALQLAKVPIVNYQFQVISLEQISSDYSHEAVRIGDTCTAIDDSFVPVLQIGVRIIEIKRNLLEYDKTQITLGNFKPDLAKSQMFQNQINSKVSNNAGIWDNGAALVPSVLDPAMYDLTSKLRAAGGYVVFDPVDGIMIYDTPDPAMATKAMKLGAGIFGIANTKTLGEWVWRTFGDGAGFTADLITVGKISADKVQIGTGAQVLGSSTFYWDTSGLYAVNGSNVVKITSGGISIGTAGVGGAFSTAITGEGVVAEKILAGVITGVTISAGTITAGTITGGTITGAAISGGTIDGVTITGSTISALNTVTIQSGSGTGTITTGLYFGNIASGYGAKSSIKGYQYPDGSTRLDIKADWYISLIAEHRIDFMKASGEGCLITCGNLNSSGIVWTNTLRGLTSDAKVLIGLGGSGFENTSDGTVRLKSGTGAYLTMSGSSLGFYDAGGTYHAIF